MSKDRLLEALKHSKKRSKDDAETARAIAKMRSQIRLSSQEFLKVYDTMWQEGPRVKHETPDVKG
jgi:phage-related minor tail protein